MDKRLLSDEILDRVAGRFRVLGDQSRLTILRALLVAGEMSVSELVDTVGMQQANVSKHLRLLHEARLVGRRREGTSVYYRVVDPTVSDLCDIVCGRLVDEAEQEVATLAGR